MTKDDYRELTRDPVQAVLYIAEHCVELRCVCTGYVERPRHNVAHTPPCPIAVALDAAAYCRNPDDPFHP
jgi:hypothetical protein